MNVVIDLPWDEEFRAAQAGFRRNRNAHLRRGRPRFYPRDWSLWEAHVQGAGSECGVHLWTGLPWSSEHDDLPPFAAPDVGDDIEVRWVWRSHVLRFDERDFAQKAGSRFILATGNMPHYELLGWMPIPDTPAAIDQWGHRYDERMTWEVPESQLRDMDTFEVAVMA
jgi:hypothetical protein